MDAESIAGLIGLGIGLLVLVSLSVYERANTSVRTTAKA